MIVFIFSFELLEFSFLCLFIEKFGKFFLNSSIFYLDSRLFKYASVD